MWQPIRKINIPRASMALKEEQIRPAEIFNRYLELAEEDAKWISSTSKMENINCWSCGCSLKTAFTKLNFTFAECSDCQSIIANPRPSERDIGRFYQEGKSPAYWASTFYRSTAESRREHLWKPKAKDVAEIISNMPTKPAWICDIGAGFGIFIQELQKLLPNTKILAIEPTPSLAEELKLKGIHTIPKFLADVLLAELPDGPGFFTSFELLEHLQNPLDFLRQVNALCSKNSKFLATTLSSWGLDICLLREHSKAIFPPHHLQILSPKAVKKLARHAGFSGVKVTTPGKLDVDIAKKSLAFIQEPFWRTFLAEADEDGLARMQSTLVASGFSSHMWCLFDN